MEHTDRQERIQQIKKAESDFLNTIDDLIKNKYREILFAKYKQTIKDTADCYQNPKLSFKESKECAKTLMDSYLEKEKQFENLFGHYEVNFIR